MSSPKHAKGVWKTVRIYSKDFNRVRVESERTGVPIVKIIEKLIATLDKFVKKD